MNAGLGGLPGGLWLSPSAEPDPSSRRAPDGPDGSTVDLFFAVWDAAGLFLPGGVRTPSPRNSG